MTFLSKMYLYQTGLAYSPIRWIKLVLIGENWINPEKIGENLF